MAAGFTYRHYILKDHLGSWTTVTDAEGNVEQELSYDAWGNLRDADTWTGTGTEAPMFDRGYTGHEHITAFGLINMNGRCYDPLMSSFLSVDEYVQDPSNAQNFNRYAYCLNNPLKYTDPSGWFYQGGSHSVASDENARRLVVNSELYAEQYERFFGQKENHKAYYMEGEEQKGGGGAGSSFSANIVYNSDGSCKVSVTYYGSDGPTFQSFEYSKEEMLTFGNSDPAYVASVVGEGACVFMSLGEICHRLGDDISNAEYWKEKDFLYFVNSGLKHHGYEAACIVDFIQWIPKSNNKSCIQPSEYRARWISSEMEIPSVYDGNCQFLIAVALSEKHARTNNVGMGHAVVLNSFKYYENSNYYEMGIGDPSPHRLVQSNFYHQNGKDSKPSGVDNWWFIKIWRP